MRVSEIIWVSFKFETWVRTSFKIRTSLNVSFISLYNSAFNQCEELKLSTQRGKLIFILSTGNSYKMLLKILLISSKERFVQSVQTTGLEYFASKSLARFFVSFYMNLV